MLPAPGGYSPYQRSRRNRRSRSTRPPLEAVRRPTLAFGTPHTSAPVHRCVGAPRPKARAGSRLSLASRHRWSEPAAGAGNWTVTTALVVVGHAVGGPVFGRALGMRLGTGRRVPA